MRTKPFKDKKKQTFDIRGKEIYEIYIEPFGSENFLNLVISAHSGSKNNNYYVGQSSIIVLHSSQIEMLEKAIKNYKEHLPSLEIHR